MTLVFFPSPSFPEFNYKLNQRYSVNQKAAQTLVKQVFKVVKSDVHFSAPTDVSIKSRSSSSRIRKILIGNTANT